MVKKNMTLGRVYLSTKHLGDGTKVRQKRKVGVRFVSLRKINKTKGYRYKKRSACSQLDN